MTPDKAYSVASVSKALFRKMGITPLSKLQPDFPAHFHGFAMEAYYGGRVECHIRRRVEQITYLDVLSMYPTCFILLRLWWLVVGRRLEIVDATEEMRALLDSISLDRLFNKNTWPQLHGLVLLEPNFDVLPVRADYKGDGDLQIGLNEVRADPGYYTVADAIVSKLRTGRSPKVLKGYRLVPIGLQGGLKPLLLRGKTLVDPAGQDFFKSVIEARQAIKRQDVLTAHDKAQEHFLKIIANTAAYGIFGEFNEEPREKGVSLKVFGSRELSARTNWFEKPGLYCNPYIASSVTGAARLILTMLELCAKELGSTYVMCDTDAMGVVDPTGIVGDAIVDRFSALNPYTFAGSILKIEDENYRPGTRDRLPLFAFSIASKRYVLFNRDPKTGKPIIRKALEHGLGHLLPPAGETHESWVSKFWGVVLCKHEGRRCEEPTWFDKTALAQLSITSPHLLASFRKNETVTPSRRVSPFNFMLVGYSTAPREGRCKKHELMWRGCRDSSPCRFRAECSLVDPIRPVAKYARDVELAERLQWWDSHTGRPIAIETGGRVSGLAGRVPLKTFGDVFAEFVIHAEAKAADAEGHQATGETCGELRCMRIDAVSRMRIGKEARDLEKNHVLGLADKAVLRYDAGWPALRVRLRHFQPSAIAELSGISRAQVYELLREDGPQPHLSTNSVLLETVKMLERGSNAILAAGALPAFSEGPKRPRVTR